MYYNSVLKGKFISRPNRFIANIEICGKAEVCHVKNTGRCRELLISGADVVVVPSEKPMRKTKYDLVAVYKGNTLVNIDSQAPNKIAGEYIKTLIPDAAFIKAEFKVGDSRLDYYVERENGSKVYMEVKGVTLEENSIAMFPDAPTERGIKHINELIECVKCGNEAYILFVIQMKGISLFTPNYRTHQEFGDALKKAEEVGVKIAAVDCEVTPDSLTAGELIPIKL